ncbi:MAG: Mut7-C RNAse domain-containing protein [Desulfobacterales bacterium]|nr:Mut7-C RNAse domain-containing protein [Desulfobacterales bacterium]
MALCFAAEKTLGRLAKWLRILGFDTLFEPDLPAGYFSGLEPERLLLTRRKTCRQSRTDNACVVIRTDHYWDQLGEVIQAVGMTAESIKPFSRCICCNSAIISVDKAHLHGKVPDYIWETHDVFKFCRRCQRVYWPGSHIERSMERITCLFNG